MSPKKGSISKETGRLPTTIFRRHASFRGCICSVSWGIFFIRRSVSSAFHPVAMEVAANHWPPHFVARETSGPFLLGEASRQPTAPKRTPSEIWPH